MSSPPPSLLPENETDREDKEDETSHREEQESNTQEQEPQPQSPTQPKKKQKPKQPKTQSHILLQSFPQIPSNHITIGLSNSLAQNKQHEHLFRHRRLPDHGWTDLQIQSLLLTLSNLDTTNHSPPIGSSSYDVYDNNESRVRRWCGVGEREGRVYSSLVSHRHYGLSHGVGRSGDLTEPQPKAVGSSVLAELTRCLVLDAMRRGSGLDGSKGPSRTKQTKHNPNKKMDRVEQETESGGGLCAVADRGDGWDGAGGGPARFGIVLPMCTGMSMSLVLAALRDRQTERDRRGQMQREGGDSEPSRTVRDIVLWSRIDQKSCFKAILSAGLTCIIIPTRLDSDRVVTDLSALQTLLTTHTDRILAVISTTSCFAPRCPDSIDEIAKLCAERGVAHVVNNAYGLQCRLVCKLMNRACVVGRVDAVVCSTDKNFLVPVGGAVVTSPSQTVIQSIGKVYAGRASATPALDLFITLLSMGLNGYKRLLDRRQALIVRFRRRLEEVATAHGERVLCCPQNTISYGLTLDTLAADVAEVDTTVPSDAEGSMEGGRKTANDNNDESDDKERARWDEKADVTSLFGSMLFTRCVSGTRVVPRFQTKSIGGQTFQGFGSSTNGYPHAYLTAACAVGLAEDEMEEFFDRLDKCFKDFFVKRKKKGDRRTNRKEKL